MKLSHRLQYVSGASWKELPSWARQLIELGSTVSKPGKGKHVISLALPTRAFAAGLIGLGVVTGRLGSTTENQSEHEHFQRLCNLPPGTPVLYRTAPQYGRTRQYRGMFVGTDSANGQTLIRVQVQNTNGGALTHLVPRQRCMDITILAGEAHSLPKSQSGRQVNTYNPFIDTCLGAGVSRRLTNEAQLDCLFVGQKSQLEDELVQTRFGAVMGRKSYCDGTLHDLLRVRCFQSPSVPFRSDVFPVNSVLRNGRRSESKPSVVIFDGARGFVRWRTQWPDAHWVVLLDRCDPNCQDAVALLNQGYQNRSADGSKAVLGLRFSPGVELLAYRRG